MFVMRPLGCAPAGKMLISVEGGFVMSVRPSTTGLQSLSQKAARLVIVIKMVQRITFVRKKPKTMMISKQETATARKM